MQRFLRLSALCASLAVSSTALCAERTVTLVVDRMSCATCPYIVQHALSRHSGVKQAAVSFDTKTATVTFDDAVTSVGALTKVTADVGFPSRLAAH